MGQAKQRGSKEQRVAEAIERDEKQRLAYQELLRRQPSPKLSKSQAAMFSALGYIIIGGK